MRYVIKAYDASSEEILEDSHDTLESALARYRELEKIPTLYGLHMEQTWIILGEKNNFHDPELRR